MMNEICQREHGRKRSADLITNGKIKASDISCLNRIILEQGRPMMLMRPFLSSLFCHCTRKIMLLSKII